MGPEPLVTVHQRSNRTAKWRRGNTGSGLSTHIGRRGFHAHDRNTGGMAADPVTDATGHGAPGWRRRLFQPAAEGDFRRRTRDWVQLAVVAVLLVLAAHHAGNVTASERALFDLFNTLPNGLAPLFRGLYRLGTLWAVGLVVVAALVARRWRLALVLSIAGLLAWGTARAIGQIVVAHEAFAHSVRIAASFGGSPAFPAVRLAVTVAVISAASPYVARPTRVFGWTLVLGLGVAAMQDRP